MTIIIFLMLWMISIQYGADKEFWKIVLTILLAMIIFEILCWLFWFGFFGVAALTVMTLFGG